VVVGLPVCAPAGEPAWLGLIAAGEDEDADEQGGDGGARGQALAEGGA